MKKSSVKHIWKDLINHYLQNTQKINITDSRPTVNHAGSCLAEKISHPFLMTISLVHQHKSLAVMRAAVKLDPACEG